MRLQKEYEHLLPAEPDPFYPPSSEIHAEAFQTFFTQSAVDWSEFFAPEDFNINPDCRDINQHHMALGLKLAIMFRDHFEDNYQDWEEA